jgi:hypothetical protein
MQNRETLLAEASRLVSQDREATYGKPGVNLACAGELKAVARKWRDRSVRPISDAEWDAIEQTFTKLARAITGTVNPENYIDGAGYLGLAGELAQEHHENLMVLERKMQATTAGERPPLPFRLPTAVQKAETGPIEPDDDRD